jgi:hypothetical protein
MSTKPSDSFVRWQSATREHFTLTSSVVLGLSTGLLAFFSERFLSGSRPSCGLLLLGLAALLLLAASITLALWCSINRLRDFRATAQIARRRDNNESVPPEDRLETKILGELSWRLFWWQLILFGVGAVATAVALLARGWP